MRSLLTAMILILDDISGRFGIVAARQRSTIAADFAVALTQGNSSIAPRYDDGNDIAVSR